MNLQRAREKIVQYVSLRDHSEKEIRTKLKKFFEDDIVDLALKWALEYRYIPDSPEAEIRLSERVADGLSRRKKGTRFIQNSLRQKGLPQVKIDPEVELTNALDLASRKVAKQSAGLDNKKAQERVGRYLLSRGFTSDIVKKVIYGQNWQLLQEQKK